MNKNLVFAATAGLLTALTLQAQHIDKKTVLKRLSLEDKARFVIGTGMPGINSNQAVVGSTQKLVPGAAGTTYPLDSLGIPAIVLADGPAGLRINSTRPGDSATYYCTHFPIATLLASTWNEQLVENVGKAMGQEVKEYGVDVLLAPATNIHRNPLNGRNFEYYSEDPLVAGKTAAAYIRGIQSNGVGTSLKHFAANNQETNRMNTDARISQRALREIYLKPFEIAVKEAQPWTVMSSYNRINGTYTSESKELLTDILRNEWGFKGTVMSDWNGGRDGATQIWAGNDMLQPGKPEQYTSIVEGVKSGKLNMEDLDRDAERILDLIEKTPRYKRNAFSNHPDLKAHALVTRQSATEGMVLLKNNGALPIKPGKDRKTRIALYGCTSYDFIAGGTGSGNVNHAYVVSLQDGLKNAGYSLNDQLHKFYVDYLANCAAKKKAEADSLMKIDKMKAFMTMFLPGDRATEPRIEASTLAQQAKTSDAAIVTIGRISGEFVDRKLSQYNLTDAEQNLIANVCQAYHKAGKKVIVLLNVGGVMETASWKKHPDAILCAWQGGQEGGNSVADIISGNVCPSGKLTMTWPEKITDDYTYLNFPVDKEPIIDFTNNGRKNNNEKNVDYTDYNEDVYVGYRYFDSFDKPVSYPFGYGLSYTTFTYSNARIAQSKTGYTVTVDVTNSGKCAGKEVVELYVAAPNSKALNKPAKELKAFAKTRTLQPHETERVTMNVAAADLASFSESMSAWKVDAGTYLFLLGASSRDIRATLKANANPMTIKVNNVLKPQVRLNLLKR